MLNLIRIKTLKREPPVSSNPSKKNKEFPRGHVVYFCNLLRGMFGGLMFLACLKNSPLSRKKSTIRKDFFIHKPFISKGFLYLCANTTAYKILSPFYPQAIHNLTKFLFPLSQQVFGLPGPKYLQKRKPMKTVT